ncbi:hypothetical protein EMIT0158MI4_50363 [Burkholderia ambifaria]
MPGADFQASRGCRARIRGAAHSNGPRGLAIDPDPYHGVDISQPNSLEALCISMVSVGDRLRVRVAGCGLPGIARVSRENSGRRAF